MEECIGSGDGPKQTVIILKKRKRSKICIYFNLNEID
jgi:hypothetical protein